MDVSPSTRVPILEDRPASSAVVKLEMRRAASAGLRAKTAAQPVRGIRLNKINVRCDPLSNDWTPQTNIELYGSQGLLVTTLIPLTQIGTLWLLLAASGPATRSHVLIISYRIAFAPHSCSSRSLSGPAI